MTDSEAHSTHADPDWRELRRQERRQRRAARRDGGADAWARVPVGGLVLLAVGLALLGGHFGLHLPERWWTAFLLVPAAAALVSSIRFYHADGMASRRVIGAAIGGSLLLALALGLYFGLHAHLLWPLLLVAIGAGIVWRGLRRG